MEMDAQAATFARMAHAGASRSTAVTSTTPATLASASVRPVFAPLYPLTMAAHATIAMSAPTPMSARTANARDLP